MDASQATSAEAGVLTTILKIELPPSANSMKDFSLEEEWTHRRSGGAPDRPEDPRSPYERDRSRLMHTGGFRRLQGKTQVLGLEESDFHRTRLTHSMETVSYS